MYTTYLGRNFKIVLVQLEWVGYNDDIYKLPERNAAVFFNHLNMAVSIIKIQTTFINFNYLTILIKKNMNKKLYLLKITKINKYVFLLFLPKNI